MDAVDVAAELTSSRPGNESSIFDPFFSDFNVFEAKASLKIDGRGKNQSQQKTPCLSSDPINQAIEPIN
jgi:hypothetical protein